MIRIFRKQIFRPITLKVLCSTLPAEQKPTEVSVQDYKVKYLRPLSKDMLVNRFNLDLLTYPQIDSNFDLERANDLYKKLSELMKRLEMHSSETLRSSISREQIIERILQTGVMGLSLPRLYGGGDYNIMMLARVFEAISRDSKFLMNTFTPSVLAMQAILHGGNEDQKNASLSRLSRGELIGTVGMYESNLDGLTSSDIKMTASLDASSECYVLNGFKSRVYGFDKADILIVFAKINEEMILPFVIDVKLCPGITAKRHEHNNDCCDLQFDNVPIPVVNLLSGTSGLELMRKLGTISNISSTVASCCIMKSLLERTNQFLCNRLVFGKPLTQFDTMRYQICRVTDDAYVTESLAYYVAGLVDTYPHNDIYIESCLGKVESLNSLTRSMNLCIQLMGLHALTVDDPEFGGVLNNAQNLLLNEVSRNETRDAVMKESSSHLTANIFEKDFTERFGYKLGFLKITGVFENAFYVDTLKYNLHPRVGYLVDDIYQILDKLSKFLRKLYKTNQEVVIYNEEFLSKLSNVVTHLLSLYSVLSRASRSISIGLFNHELEVKIAEFHSKEIIRRVRVEIDEIIRFPEDLKTINEVAKAMKEMGGCVVTNKFIN